MAHHTYTCVGTVTIRSVNRSVAAYFTTGGTCSPNVPTRLDVAGQTVIGAGPGSIALTVPPGLCGPVEAVGVLDRRILGSSQVNLSCPTTTTTPATTTTAAPATTTTAAPTRATSTTVTAATSSPTRTLPYTGGDTLPVGGAALALATIGAALVAVSRRRQ